MNEPTWTEAASEDVIARRFRLLEELGRGGNGVVHVATDLATGREVALKQLFPQGDEDSARFEREVTALAMLDDPGIVPLIAHGHWEGRPWIAMERIHGVPFPGPGTITTWDPLAPIVTRLLETLDRLHGLGVVHRDLKPTNVLVRADGQPVILDFGLARGGELSETITRTGTALGTPHYWSPEQALADRVDARTDLYAVGCMIYEALSGRVPHADEDASAMYQARCLHRAQPLSEVAPEVPESIASAVDQLLERERGERPPSARAALLALTGDTAVTEVDGLGWIGPDTPLIEGWRVLEQGHRLHVAGAPGTGRTHLCRALARRWREARGEVAWLKSGRRPLASLPPSARDDLATHAWKTRDEALEATVAWLEEAKSRGTLFAVDNRVALDPLTRDALAHASAGPTLRADGPGATDATVTLDTWRRADLVRVFHEDNPWLHIAEDATRELLRRTAGVPQSIVREVDAWLRAGIATLENGRIRLTRADLHRLEAGLLASPVDVDLGRTRELSADQKDLLAWIVVAGPSATLELLARAMDEAAWSLETDLQHLAEAHWILPRPDGSWHARLGQGAVQTWPPHRRADAHLAIARALPPGSDHRLGHLLRGQGPAHEIVDEALEVATSALDQGRPERATSFLASVLGVARTEGAEAVARVLRAWLDAAVACASPSALRTLAYSVQPEDRPEDFEGWTTLVLAGARAEDADPEALAALDALGTLSDAHLEAIRQRFRFTAARVLDGTTRSRVLQEVDRWCDDHGVETLRGALQSWKGLDRYRSGRFDEAVALYRQALPLRRRPREVLGTRLNLGVALLDAGAFDEAAETAQASIEEAVRLRDPLLEGRARWLLRAADYRRARHTPPDMALVEAARALGVPGLLSLTLRTEAAHAWRLGHLDTARGLANQLLKVTPRHVESIWALDAAFSRLLAPKPPHGQGSHPAQEIALRQAVPSLDGQTLVLLTLAGHADARVQDALDLQQTRTSPDAWHRRRDLVAFAERLAR